jgi:hypothetical protein
VQELSCEPQEIFSRPPSQPGRKNGNELLGGGDIDLLTLHASGYLEGMWKIPTIYQRDPATKLRHVKNERHPDCGWVFAGEGTPTYKWNGTAVLIDSDNAVWKRREIKKGRSAPDRFRQEGEADPVTGKRVGWVLCDRDDPADQWHWEAYDKAASELAPGTYELIGPKVQGNPHGIGDHVLMPHGDGPDLDPPTDFDALGAWLHQDNTNTAQPGFEGIVWHHPDGRMAKIKARDFPG